MKIHLWSPGFDPSDGGIQAYSHELRRALTAIPAVTRIASIERGSSVATFIGKASWRALRERPDWIFTTHRNFLPLAKWLRKFTGSKVAASLHGIEAWHAPPYHLRIADLLLPVSTFTRDRVAAALGETIPRMELLANTFDAERFFPGDAPAGLRHRHALPPGAPVLLTVGRLDANETYKGHDQVLQALPAVLERHPQCRYLIVGAGSDRSRLELLRDRLVLGNSVIFTGRVSAEELPDYYRLSDVFVMPSKGEGFGIALLEAMACGIPVIAGYKDGCHDALRGGELGRLVDPDRPEEITQAIFDALDTRPGASVPVAKYFGRDAFHHRLEEIINSCAA